MVLGMELRVYAYSTKYSATELQPCPAAGSIVNGKDPGNDEHCVEVGHCC